MGARHTNSFKDKMAKINVQDIVAEMQKLYKSDKKVQSLICTGDSVKSEYTAADVIPLPTEHPLRQLINLPGLPYNKIIQIVGNADTGKSTLAGEVMAAAQKAGAWVILWDSETKFDSNRFKNKFKGDPSKILMIQTNEILKGGELTRKYITALKDRDPEAKILFVWDSIGGSQSRSHAEREMDDEKHAQPGQDAKENSSFMKVLVAIINKYPDSIAVYMANQSYAKIGFMQKGDAATGGKKIEYHSSFIVFLKRIKTLTRTVKGVINKYGIITRATVSKNHLSQSHTTIHQLDFQVTADGTVLDDSIPSSEASDDE
jgi:RecA/RadA recombinase